MSLWAVRVYQPEGDFSSYFPVLNREEADESAARVNEFMTHLNNKHGEAVVLNVAAEVIEWPDAPEEHALQLNDLIEKEEAG